MNGTAGDLTGSSEGLLVEDHDPVSGYSAVFDDDGKTAYAYLSDGKRIVADVWLYNRGESPDDPEWDDPGKMPFANPKGYANGELFPPVADPSQLRFEWALGAVGPTLRIFIRGEAFGVLTPGSKPGWSKLALANGPLALKLEEAPPDES